MREIRTSGSVRGEEGNLLIYSTQTQEPAFGWKLEARNPRSETDPPFSASSADSAVNGKMQNKPVLSVAEWSQFT